MRKPKTYHIDTFEKLLNVATEENLDRLSLDFLLWFNYVVKFVNRIKKEKGYTDVKNSDIFKKISFTWIDDGKNELKYVQITNPDTGEITNFPMPKLKQR